MMKHSISVHNGRKSETVSRADTGMGGSGANRAEARKIIGTIAVILGWSFAAVSIFQTFLPGIVFATPTIPINGTLIALSLGWAFSGISTFLFRARMPLYLPALSSVILVSFLIYFRTIGGG